MAPNLVAGRFFSYGIGSGDLTNRLADPNIFVHPSVRMGAEMGANGAVDARVASKIKMVEPRTSRGLMSSEAFTMYEAPTASVPIIRNEELILLRAEAARHGDLPGAIADMNFIREKSGGLAPRADLTAANVVDEVLKQRFYSLLFEGGHRWLDMRRRGLLEQLPNDRPVAMPGLPAHQINARFPIPQNETDARTPP